MTTTAHTCNFDGEGHNSRPRRTVAEGYCCPVAGFVAQVHRPQPASTWQPPPQAQLQLPAALLLQIFSAVSGAPRWQPWKQTPAMTVTLLHARWLGRRCKT